ncbi:MAG TPA: FAD-dependent oxidoreductase [Streptosporangiaceae bacterium]|nr:FAD-dependent oxidoreductase [Streptosporangiaceae bacterium]
MRADLVVIGAGALGLSTALHAALAGKSVAVVDAHAAGSQASGRAAGLFKSVQADELRTWLARRSIERAISFADWAGAELDVVRSGSFLVARTDEHRAYLRTEASQSGGWGVDVSQASPGQLADGLSYYQGAGSDLALWCPEDIYIEEPMSLILAYVAACRTHGVEIFENEPVTGITLSGGKVAGVQTTVQTISTAAAVDAAGAWTRQLAELAGGRVAVAPVRHQLAITEPTTEVDPSAPIGRVVDAAVYLRPARGGLMIGGFESAPLPVDPRGEVATFSTDDVPLDPSELRKLADQVSSEVPQATGLPVAEYRGGLFTMSPDGRFAAGPVPEVPGLWTVTGCNGSGFSSSLALGEALADWIVTDAATSRIAELAPSRFGPLTDDQLVNAGIWQYAHYYDPGSVS